MELNDAPILALLCNGTITRGEYDCWIDHLRAEFDKAVAEHDLYFYAEKNTK